MKKKNKKWEVVEKEYRRILADEIRRSQYILSHREKEIGRLREEIKGLKEIGRIKDAFIQVLSKGIFGKNISYDDITDAINSPCELEIKNTGDGYRIRAGRQRDK